MEITQGNPLYDQVSVISVFLSFLFPFYGMSDTMAPDAMRWAAFWHKNCCDTYAYCAWEPDGLTHCAATVKRYRVSLDEWSQ
jgi:hypothetical protein